MSATAEKMGFQAEVKQLLQLMIHSLYSNKEIFLRELISNASDAADKLRFEALGNGALFESDPELNIRIAYDKAARTITVSDNGIGMSREEVIHNIGTIARSGTREFFKGLTGDQARDANLIGQFGVGFYASFIVADKVTLVTRRAGLPADQAVRWECDMAEAGEYTIAPAVKDKRGTDIVLHLRKVDEDEESPDALLDGYRLRAIVRKYSDHIAVPIIMTREGPVAESDKKPAAEDETINQANAIWARPKAEVTEEQYHEFYRHVAHDFEPPLAYSHNRVEGRQEYTQLLYIPQRAPFDLWDREHRRGLKLYVRRVFIMDDAEHLLPAYLRFVRGVVDSSDLPLNVSREILQQSRDIDAIRSGNTRRVLQILDDLAENQPEKYATFWQAFGRVLKEGMGEDPANRDRLAKLLRFSSTHTDSSEPTVSLAEYVSRMKPDQDKIYYVTAESFLAAKGSPHLEVLRKKGVEALLLHERIDEWVVGNLHEFEGKALVSAAKGALDLGKLEDASEKKAQEEKAGEFTDVVAKMKEILNNRVKDVRVTHRLTSSPACLVADENDVGGNLARILKMAGQTAPDNKPILEINPAHPLIERMKTEGPRFGDWSHLMFDQALLAEGGVLEDPAGFVRRMNDLLLEVGRG
jgi:molecular chaperone HtpG